MNLDCSETHIKMCDCEEIQKHGWKESKYYDDGDFLAVALKEDDGDSISVVHCCNCEDEIDKKIEWAWLPRQDQLQEILWGNNFSLPNAELKVFYESVHYQNEGKYYKKFTSMEQLWLAFVMKEKYNKTWNGKKWQ